MATFKKVLKWIGAIVLVVAIAGFAAYLIYLRPVMKKMEQTTVVKYDKDLTIVLGGGGNSGILVSDSLVIVIDTKMGDAAEELAKMAKELAGNKPILVVNTHDHTDHTSGNKYYSGQTIVAGGNYTEEIWIAKSSKKNLPTKWLKDKMDINMGDEKVTVLNLDRPAHTESDVFVYLHKRKMLFGGDVILNKQVPALLGNVADPDGYLYALDMLPKQFEIREVVPGHGPMGGIEIIDNFRQYFTDMKTAASDDSKKDEMIAKYGGWVQVPLIMSPEATIRTLKKKAENK